MLMTVECRFSGFSLLSSESVASVSVVSFKCDLSGRKLVDNLFSYFESIGARAVEVILRLRWTFRNRKIPDLFALGCLMFECLAASPYLIATIQSDCCTSMLLIDLVSSLVWMS